MAAILPAMAQVPKLLEYDGFLSGNITGNRTMGVRLYNASKNGTLLYKETIGTVKVTSGEFYFQYGQNGTLGNGTAPTSISAVLTGSQNWLAVTVNGTEQTPRAPLLSVPFALRSADAQKTDADLRKVVDAVGKVVVAFGGNASNLLSNPTGTIATMESTAKNVLEMQKRFRVIGITGNLSFGNSSTTRQLVISNTGFDRLVVSGITYPSGFSGSWSGTIAPGASQNVAVTFTPTALQTYSGTIAVASDASSGVGTISVSGQGARNVVVSGNMSFGNNTVGVASQRSLTIRNTGTMNLTVSGIAYPSGFSGAWSGTIVAGASQNVVVTFTPTAVQAYSGNITVNSNAAGGVVTWAASGVGVAPPLANMVTVVGGALPQSSGLAGQSVASFQIGKYEVTWGEWKAVRDWTVSNNKGYDLAGVGDTYILHSFLRPSGSADNFPVINVSWYDVVKWCNARSEKEGFTPVYQNGGGTIYKTGEVAATANVLANGYRLPSEKEWEWAARGGVIGAIPKYGGEYTYSGSYGASEVAWTFENSSDGTKGVGTKAANELGIYDMSGNVREWCEDALYLDGRRLRGGSWFHYSFDHGPVARRGNDDNYAPNSRHNWIGFRLARSSGN
jgi:formylglycine-generating enzyme required for sulfatase activity